MYETNIVVPYYGVSHYCTCILTLYHSLAIKFSFNSEHILHHKSDIDEGCSLTGKYFTKRWKICAVLKRILVFMILPVQWTCFIHVFIVKRKFHYYFNIIQMCTLCSLAKHHVLFIHSQYPSCACVPSSDLALASRSSVPYMLQHPLDCHGLPLKTIPFCSCFSNIQWIRYFLSCESIKWCLPSWIKVSISALLPTKVQNIFITNNLMHKNREVSKWYSSINLEYGCTV